MITGMKIMDTTAGFICYRKDVLENIKPEHIKSVGYGFQIEMKFSAWKMGYKIIEIPIIFTDRKLGASKMSGGIFNEALWGILMMKCRSLFIKYNKK
jgi:dolichol-phosphate mannosyltransferase